MALFSETSRSKFESTAYTVLLLAFFFAVGLAGGVLYRLLPTTTSNQVTAQTARPQASAVPAVAPAAPVKAADAASAAPAPPVVTASAKLAATKADAAPSVAPATAKPVTAKMDTASAPVASTSVALPAALAPIGGEAPSMTAAVVPLSAPVTAEIPPPAKPATSDPAAARPTADGKPSAPTRPKAAPEKRVATASKEPAPRPATVGAPGSVRVQFGAYTIEDNAHETQWAVEATGLPVEVTQETTRKGHVLFYVRSQPFADRAAALSAAAAAQQKAKSFVNPVAIDYMIVGDAGQPTQQAQAAAH